MKGVYVLFFYLPEPMNVEVGSLGMLNFKEGYYAYTGSAQNGLDSRLRRHAKKHKKMHWHIDHLTVHADDFSALTLKSPRKMECELAERISHFGMEVTGFGCTDCKCTSHLFYLGEKKNKNQIVHVLNQADFFGIKKP